MPQPSFPLDCAKQLGDAELTVKLFIETVGYGMWRRSTSLVKYYGATVGPIPILFAIAIRDLDALRTTMGEILRTSFIPTLTMFGVVAYQWCLQPPLALGDPSILGGQIEVGPSSELVQHGWRRAASGCVCSCLIGHTTGPGDRYLKVLRVRVGRAV